MMLAVIDIGSNAVKMKIYADGNVVYTDREQTRLIQNMDQNCRLNEQSIKRTLGVLVNFCKKAEENGVEKVCVVATAAVRRASNRDYFLAEAEKADIHVRVLSEYEEAYYGLCGVSREGTPEDAVLLDVGGGSSELTLCKNCESESFPFGAVSLAQLQSEEAFYSHIADRIKKSKLITNLSTDTLVVIGGTAGALLDFFCKRKVSYKRLTMLLEEVKKTPLAKRNNIKGLPEERADVILSGITIIASVAEYIKAKKIIFSLSGVSDGIAAEMMK